MLGVVLALIGQSACATSSDLGADRSASAAPPGAEPVAGFVESRLSGTAVLTKIAQLPGLITFLDGHPDDRTLVVGDRQGVIRRLVRTEVDGYTVPVMEPEPVLDLSAEVSLLGERGSFDREVRGRREPSRS